MIAASLADDVDVLTFLLFLLLLLLTLNLASFSSGFIWRPIFRRHTFFAHFSRKLGIFHIFLISLGLCHFMIIIIFFLLGFHCRWGFSQSIQRLLLLGWFRFKRVGVVSPSRCRLPWLSLNGHRVAPESNKKKRKNETNEKERKLYTVGQGLWWWQICGAVVIVVGWYLML